MPVRLPQGFRAAGIYSGVKRNTSKLDLALFVSDRPAVGVGVYTTNLVCASPVKLDRARTPSDFAAASGTVTFPADSTMRTVTVRVRGDRLKERREALTVRLSKARGATVARASATVTIVDNDR